MSINLSQLTDEQRKSYWKDYETFEAELELELAVLIPMWEEEFLQQQAFENFSDENIFEQ